MQKGIIFIIFFLVLSFFQIQSAVCEEMINFSELENYAKAGDESAQQELITILATNMRSSNRAKAAQAIGNAKVKSANEQLLTSLEIDDDHVRYEIILALAKINDPENLQPILNVYYGKKETSEMKKRAVECLGYFDHAKSIYALKNALTISAYKAEAIEALGRTKSAQAVAPLIGLLMNNTSYLQVAQALAELNQPSSYDDIIKILDKKVDKKEFDDTFDLLTDLLKSQKYVKAQKVFARAYLTLPENEKLIRKFILDALKAFNMNTSYAVVTTNILNVRQTMNIRGKKIGSIVLGEVVEIIERSPFMQTVDEMEDFWYKIKTDGTLSGWCFGGYLNVLDHTQLPNE
jgi:HEAT repeat protein